MNKIDKKHFLIEIGNQNFYLERKAKALSASEF